MTTRRQQQSKLGVKLSSLRYQAHLSREWVATHSGISYHLLQSLEQGRTANPTIKTLLGLASSLRVPVGELIDCITVDIEAERNSLTSGERLHEPAPSST